VEHDTRRQDALALDGLFRRVTGWIAAHVGADDGGLRAVSLSLCQRAGGRFPRHRVQPAEGEPVDLHHAGIPGLRSDPEPAGKTQDGESCLYINKLADVDMDVLEELIRAGLKDLGEIHDVTPT
jgi:hypothetical protein